MIQNNLSQRRFNNWPLLLQQLAVILGMAFSTIMQLSMSVYATGQNPGDLVRAIWVKETGDYYFKTEQESQPYTIYKSYGPTYTLRFDLKLRESTGSGWTDWLWADHGYSGCDLRTPAGTWSSTSGEPKEGLWADYEFVDPGIYTVTGRHRGYDCSGIDITGGNVTLYVYIIKVEFSESSANSGFDGTEATPWLVVPTNNPPNTNTCKVTVTPSSMAGEIYFTVDNTNICTVSPSQAAGTPQTITLTGVADGETTLHARLGSTSGPDYASLNVEVKTKKTVELDFHYVKDIADPPHATTRSPNDLDTLIGQINAIWTPQANVVFTKGSVLADDTVQKDFGDAVTKLQQGMPGDDWYEIVALRNGDPPDIYCVFDLEDSIGACNGYFCAGDIMVRDAGIVRSFAHELGHYLDVDPHDYQDEDRKNELMYYTDGGGTKILHSQADDANP